MTLATHVIGPFLLTKLLLPTLRQHGPSRVIFVASGGLYAQKVDLDDLQWRTRPFDGVRAYAQAKRAQLILTGLWAERERGGAVAGLYGRGSQRGPGSGASGVGAHEWSGRR